MSSSIRSRASSFPRARCRCDVLRAAAGQRLGVLGVQLGQPGQHGGAPRRVLRSAGVERAGQDAHKPNDIRPAAPAAATRQGHRCRCGRSQAGRTAGQMRATSIRWALRRPGSSVRRRRSSVSPVSTTTGPRLRERDHGEERVKSAPVSGQPGQRPSSSPAARPCCCPIGTTVTWLRTRCTGASFGPPRRTSASVDAEVTMSAPAWYVSRASDTASASPVASLTKPSASRTSVPPTRRLPRSLATSASSAPAPPEGRDRTPPRAHPAVRPAGHA